MFEKNYNNNNNLITSLKRIRSILYLYLISVYTFFRIFERCKSKINKYRVRSCMKFDPETCKMACRQLLSRSLQRVNIKTIFCTSVTDDIPHQVL